MLAMCAEKYRMPFLDTAWELGLPLNYFRYIAACACLCLHNVVVRGLFDDHKYQVFVLMTQGAYRQGSSLCAFNDVSMFNI